MLLFGNRRCSVLAVFLLSGHLDHGLWRSVEEDELLKQRLLQLHLSRLADHKNVRAELQDPVHARQLLKHDGPGNPVEEFPDKLSDDQNHRHVETYDAEGKRGRESISYKFGVQSHCI